MPERLDKVEIALNRKIVVIEWPSRDALLGELTQLGERAVVDAFEKVGATGPVTLTPDEKAALLRTIEHWKDQTPQGFDQYEGIEELRNELTQDVRGTDHT